MRRSGRPLIGLERKPRSSAEPERWSVTMTAAKLQPHTTGLSASTSRPMQRNRCRQNCGRVNGATRNRGRVRQPNKPGKVYRDARNFLDDYFLAAAVLNARRQSFARAKKIAAKHLIPEPGRANLAKGEPTWSSGDRHCR